MQIFSETDEILRKYEYKGSAIVQVLSDLQDFHTYLPYKKLDYVSKRLNLPLSKIYGIITFYAHFKLSKPGKHKLQICLGTACFVKNAKVLLDLIKNEESLEPGGTSSDGLVSLERVACVGNCALAPVAVLDDKIFPDMSIKKTRRLLKNIKQELGG
ncbi:MAG: NADH-quinone oxidoreductase subunit NuoE family protein [Candidatus Kariarchaeaceae archaeon]|jgi:NADH:ubiquinone oxidoreductase subunit E